MNETLFAQRLKEAMHDAYISQADLCEKTKITRSAMSQYVNGKIAPRTDKVYLLAKALHVEPVWLMGFDVPRVIDDKTETQEIIEKTAVENAIQIQNREVANRTQKVVRIDTLSADELDFLKTTDTKFKTDVIHGRTVTYAYINKQTLNQLDVFISHTYKTDIEKLEDTIKSLNIVDLKRLGKFIEYQVYIKENSSEEKETEY